MNNERIDMYERRLGVELTRNAASASTGRDEYGGASVGVRNPTQPVIGEPRGGGGACPDISTRASRQSFMGTYQGVHVYACPDMVLTSDDDVTWTRYSLDAKP